MKELNVKLYDKNIIKDCLKCTICDKDFIDNLSLVITSKCGHTFHEKCFKNYIYKDIICPKCPICNSLLLKPEIEIIPTNSGYFPDQTNSNTLMKVKI